jgi:hypothetical protein
MSLAEQQRGQGIPVGLKLSTVQHVRFAMGSVATSVDRDAGGVRPAATGTGSIALYQLTKI